MSEYFSNFPRILYDIEGKNSTTPEYEVAVNIMVRQKFRDAVKEEISMYYPYVIPEHINRADTLSHITYGNVKYTWTIFMINQMFDPYWSWPMDYRSFKSYLINKYGSVDVSKNTLHHYEQITTSRVEVTGTADPIPERTVEIDYTTYRSLGIDDRKIVYAYEYEDEKNEVNRSIQLINASYISGVLDEARQAFR